MKRSDMQGGWKGLESIGPKAASRVTQRKKTPTLCSVSMFVINYQGRLTCFCKLKTPRDGSSHQAWVTTDMLIAGLTNETGETA